VALPRPSQGRLGSRAISGPDRAGSLQRKAAELLEHHVELMHTLLDKGGIVLGLLEGSDCIDQVNTRLRHDGVLVHLAAFQVDEAGGAQIDLRIPEQLREDQELLDSLLLQSRHPLGILGDDRFRVKLKTVTEWVEYLIADDVFNNVDADRAGE